MKTLRILVPVLLLAAGAALAGCDAGGPRRSGDPSLDVWQGTPEAMDVTHAGTIEADAASLAVTAEGGGGARVALATGQVLHGAATADAPLAGALAEFWGHYLDLHTALAGDDPAAA